MLIMYFLVSRYRPLVSEGSNKLNKYLFSYIIFFAIISGTRWCVGADYWAYRTQLSNSPDNYVYFENKEYLWYAFLWLHNKLGLHFSIGLSIVSFLQMFFLVKALKEYRYILLTLPFVLFANFFYWEMMNGMRQILAACIMFYASRFIYERKIYQYYSFLLICFFIHHSVLLLVPFYFIPNNIALANKRVICIIIFVGSVIIGRAPQFQAISDYASILTMFIGYDNYTDRVKDFLSDAPVEMRSLGPMYISLMAMCIISILYGPKLRIVYGKTIKQFDLWFNLSFIFSCSYFLFSSVDIVFIRPTYYFAFYLLVMVSLVLYYLYSNRNKYGSLYFIIWLICAISMFRDMQKNAAIYPYDLSIYKSILFHN